MGASQRKKGQRGERKLATRLREAFPSFASGIRRGWQARVGCDDPDVCGLPGFWLEVKTGLKPNPRTALAQATGDAKGRVLPVAVIQDDRKDPMVCMSLDTFLHLAGAAYGLKPFLPVVAPPVADPRQLAIDEAI